MFFLFSCSTKNDYKSYILLFDINNYDGIESAVSVGFSTPYKGVKYKNYTLCIGKEELTTIAFKAPIDSDTIDYRAIYNPYINSFSVQKLKDSLKEAIKNDKIFLVSENDTLKFDFLSPKVIVLYNGNEAKEKDIIDYEKIFHNEKIRVDSLKSLPVPPLPR